MGGRPMALVGRRQLVSGPWVPLVATATTLYPIEAGIGCPGNTHSGHPRTVRLSTWPVPLLPSIVERVDGEMTVPVIALH
jgi:hypothetical protein